MSEWIHLNSLDHYFKTMMEQSEKKCRLLVFFFYKVWDCICKCNRLLSVQIVSLCNQTPAHTRLASMALTGLKPVPAVMEQKASHHLDSHIRIFGQFNRYSWLTICSRSVLGKHSEEKEKMQTAHRGRGLEGRAASPLEQLMHHSLVSGIHHKTASLLSAGCVESFHYNEQ